MASEMGDGCDVIVVGAGTAGSVLAEQLTRSGKLRVSLLEAGGLPASRWVSIPAAFTKLFKGPLDWNLETEPQRALSGRRIYTPRGKMLGGSSNMNAMLHQWCHPADFDGWAQAGATGWGWSDVEPVFRAQEQWIGEDSDPSRGRNGPMCVMPNVNARTLSHRFVAAAHRVGLGREPHYNGHAYRGAWVAELAQNDGRRFSVYDAYLQPAMQRANLEVLTDAHATRIEFAAGRACAVHVRRAGIDSRIPARAIVLAAGAYGSPQLLMLSGIGPASDLAQVGVAARVDAPEVGANLQDHPALPLVFASRDRDTLRRAESIPQLLRYMLGRRGMLASSGIEAFAFAQSRVAAVDAPDLELIFMPFEARREFLEPPQLDGFSVGIAVVAPRSRGSIKLRGRDPVQAPAIDPGLFTDADGIDLAVLWEGVQLARRIAASSPLEQSNAGEIRPGADVQSLDELLDYAGNETQTVYHPTSSCRMGSDARSVVDPQLRVRGVTGLWIADASVMPAVPRGHPNAVVAMIANRAAQWIELAALNEPAHGH